MALMNGYAAPGAGQSPAQTSKARSLKALQDRLDSLDAQRLLSFRNRDQDARAADRGFMMNGVGSPAWDLYAKDLNAQGESAKIRDIMGGGSGNLDVRAGYSGPSYDENQADLNVQTESRRANRENITALLTERAAAAESGMPQSTRALGRTANGIPREDNPEAWFNTQDDFLRVQRYLAEVEETQARGARAKASAHQADTFRDRANDFSNDEYDTGRKRDQSSWQAEFERKKNALDAESETTSKIDTNARVWDSSTARSQREFQTQQTDRKYDTQVEVATIRKSQELEKAAAQSGDKQFQAQAKMLTDQSKALMMEMPGPERDARMRQLSAMMDALYGSPNTAGAGPARPVPFNSATATNALQQRGVTVTR
jgi:hypothetical protein